MADETVWIDLDEVEAAAKKILGLLDELNGPANKLAAKVKQVQESVYGTDLVGKALQGGSSSVGGLAQHQEQVLAGIQALMQNATAVGENLRTMAARHRANDDQQATSLGGITDTGALPADPQLAGLGTASVGTVTSAQDQPLLAQTLPMDDSATATPQYAPMGRLLPTETVEATPEHALRGRLLPTEGTEVLQATQADLATPRLHGTPLQTAADTPAHQGTPASPPPIEGLGNLNPDSDFQDTDAPTLDYNTPPPLFMGPGVWTPPVA
ncbi:hypothetical protein HUT16_28670 [Kitasatospora sp. NA04385]|uniref:hypothetical protein n=1 Tax=Kitasatospora sp. NA04385 TaxID=2742135 RepID=UPI001591D206|nr:hypothetical protein [Kitasatospora sp. NA04385]QKW22525.1 hypothetical protein HUT16_28670 [Kitasatospora sp. NA04385]